MLPEDKAPVDQRFLWLDGVVSNASLALVSAGLPTSWPPTARCFFVGFAYADLPVGKVFQFAFPYGRPARAEATTAIVHAVTQEFGKPFESVPHGWKTVSVIDFPKGIPPVIKRLPTVDAWYQLDEERVCLSNREALDALLAKQT